MMPYSCMEVISVPNVIKQRILINVHFGTSEIFLVLFSVFVKTCGEQLDEHKKVTEIIKFAK